MGLHFDLPISHETRKLIEASTEAARRMPRDVKPLLGKVIVERSIEIMALIRRANIAAEKVPHLSSITEITDEIDGLLRTAVEKHWIDRKHYGEAIQRTRAVGRQASAWKKSESSRAPVPRPSRQPGPSDFQPGRAAGP